jgi:hypothetical protein
LAAVELYRATRNQQYAAEAARFAGLLRQCQEQRFLEGLPLTGFYYTDTSRRKVLHDQHMSFEETPQIALQALCDTFPNHPDWMQWYAAALLQSEYFYRRGAAISEPYRHLPNSVWPRSEIETLTRDWDVEGAVEQFNDATALSAGYHLRVFPIWRDQAYHGSTAIQMSGTAGLLASATLRGRPELEDLARLQLQWVFGGNPFSQSLMYGEGYDFQPHFAYCLRDLVGSLPVGVDSRHKDTPCWSATNTATYKEIWVVPVSRLLLSLSYAAMPSQVAKSLDVSLASTRMNPSTIRLEARVRGAGLHRVQLRTFNAITDEPEKTITLSAGKDQTLRWTLAVTDQDKPWAAVAITDGNPASRKEVFGTARELSPLP